MRAHRTGFVIRMFLACNDFALGPPSAFVKGVMATCEHPSGLLLDYPCCKRGGSRNDSRPPLPRMEHKEWSPVPSSASQIAAVDLFQDLIVSGTKPRPRNFFAGIGALSLQSLLLFAAIVIPLYQTDPLPSKRAVTMLYLPPPPAAAGATVKFQASEPVSIYTPTSSSIPSPVRRTQEAPAPPATSVGIGGGVVGGVPGGVIGGIPGGVLGAVLGSTHSVPVIAKTSEPTPAKRIRVAAKVVEA